MKDAALWRYLADLLCESKTHPSQNETLYLNPITLSARLPRIDPPSAPVTEVFRKGWVSATQPTLVPLFTTGTL